jgi:hypothetical protein
MEEALARYHWKWNKSNIKKVSCRQNESRAPDINENDVHQI